MAAYEKRGYLLENFRLFHLRSQGGAEVDYHYHEFCKLLLLVSGTGGYTVEGRRYVLQPGDIVLFGSSVYNIWHAGIYVGNGQFIHSPHSGKVVSYADLTSDYYPSHYYGAVRFTK